MIEKEQISEHLFRACPSFASVYDALDDDEKLSDYSVAGDFALHLLHLYQEDKRETFAEVIQLIEAFHVDGDDYVQNYATIGILEGIQNVWGNNKTDPEKFGELLLPVSLQYWKNLNSFWAREIPVVGFDIQ